MPLLIPNKPPNPFFTQPRKRVLPALNESSQAVFDDPNTLKLYPLEAESAAIATGRRVMAVNPLTHSRPWREGGTAPARQDTQPQRNTLGQALPKGGTMNRNTPHPAMTKPSASGHGTSPADVPVEKAVAQFRRANQGLPDGVRYEPLDDTTMRILRENGHLPAEPAPQAPIIGTPASPIQHIPTPMPVQEPPPNETRPPIEKTIEGLIQDERNAQVFYNHLAKEVSIQTTKSVLSEVAVDSASHCKQFTKMLERQFKSSFTPIEAEINTGLELQGAIALALTEENRSLRILAELLEDVRDAESEKTIQRVINKKMINYNQLLRLYAE